jgi:hypothetical protein
MREHRARWWTFAVASSLAALGVAIGCDRPPGGQDGGHATEASATSTSSGDGAPVDGGSRCDRGGAAVPPGCFEGLPEPCAPDLLAPRPSPPCPRRSLIVVDDDTATGGQKTWDAIWDAGPGSVEGCPSSEEHKFTFRETIQHIVLGGELRHADWSEVRRPGVDRGQTPVAGAIRRVRQALDSAKVDMAVVAFDAMQDAPITLTDPQTPAGDIETAIEEVRKAGHGVALASRPRCHRHALVLVGKGMTRARMELAEDVLPRLSPLADCRGYVIDLGPVLQDSLRVTVQSKYRRSDPGTQPYCASGMCAAGPGALPSLGIAWTTSLASGRVTTLRAPVLLSLHTNLGLVKLAGQNEQELTKLPVMDLRVEPLTGCDTRVHDTRWRGALEIGEGVSAAQGKLSLKLVDPGDTVAGHDVGRPPAVALLATTGYAEGERRCLDALRAPRKSGKLDVAACRGTSLAALADDIANAPADSFTTRNPRGEAGGDKRDGLRLLPVLMHALAGRTETCTALEAEVACSAE